MRKLRYERRLTYLILIQWITKDDLERIKA